MEWPQEVTQYFSTAEKTMNSTSSGTTFWSAGMIKAYSDNNNN